MVPQIVFYLLLACTPSIYLTFVMVVCFPNSINVTPTALLPSRIRSTHHVDLRLLHDHAGICVHTKPSNPRCTADNTFESPYSKYRQINGSLALGLLYRAALEVFAAYRLFRSRV